MTRCETASWERRRVGRGAALSLLTDYPSVFFGLDIASALAAVYVSFLFLRSWRVLGDDFLVTAGVGFELLALSYLAASVTERAALPEDLHDVGEAIRYVGRLAGFSMLLLSYLAARRRGRSLLVFLAGGIGVIAGVVVVAGFLLTPPFLAFPAGDVVEDFAFAVNAGLAAAVAVLASASFLRSPQTWRLQVPLGFLCLALSQYTWLLYQPGQSDVAIVLAYLWRLAALVLLIEATRTPQPPRPAEVGHAQA